MNNACWLKKMHLISSLLTFLPAKIQSDGLVVVYNTFIDGTHLISLDISVESKVCAVKMQCWLVVQLQCFSSFLYFVCSGFKQCFQLILVALLNEFSQRECINDLFLIFVYFSQNFLTRKIWILENIFSLYLKCLKLRCEIAIGLRPSLYRRKPLVQLCYFYRSVVSSF